MFNKSLLKNVLVIGISAVMLMGMAVTATAGSDYDEIEFGKNDECCMNADVNCSDTNASADTSVYAPYNASYIKAGAEVDFYAIHIETGAVINVGSDTDVVSDVGDSAYASAYITEALAGCVGYYADGYHTAEVDGYGASCIVTAGN